MTDHLERALSDVGRRWVPDRRLGVFDVSLTAPDPAGARRLVGATTSRDARAALVRLAAEAGLDLAVATLPDAAVRDEPGAVVTAALAPLLATPDIRAARASEALQGEPLDLLERRGEWVRVRAADGLHAWTHGGYLATGPLEWQEDWIGRASARATGGELRRHDGRSRLPLGARVVLRPDGRVETADGEVWSVAGGSVRRDAEWRAEAAFLAAPEWALRWYAGAPYVLGGRSDWGVDCSGLVQATYAARGVALPRDSDQQASVGTEVRTTDDGAGYEAGDLLLFAEAGRVSHVALWAGAGRVVHAALGRGGVGSDDLFGDSARARRLRAALVGVRRLRGGTSALPRAGGR